jgi:1-acyl-sn-glycerol-3-phosphate acyltransferase
VIDKLITFVYWLNVKTWVSLLSLFAARKTVEGLENVPPKGAFILVSNHLNNADPPVLTQTMPRQIVWMAKQELFDIPLVGWLGHVFGLIPVRRAEADLKALRRAQQALRKGQVLGMFPEGTRSKTGGMKEGEPGTAVIALRTGAPLLPVAIWGTEHAKLPRDLLRRTTVNIRIGKPFSVGAGERLNKARIAAATHEIMLRIAELLPEEYQGVFRKTPEPAAATKDKGTTN